MTESNRGSQSVLDVERVREIVQQVAGIVKRVTRDPSFQVRLFGSWAAGTARRHSDIDIAIDGSGPVGPAEMAEIREACDRLPTLFTIDLVDLAATSARFRQVVRAQLAKDEPR